MKHFTLLGMALLLVLGSGCKRQAVNEPAGAERNVSTNAPSSSQSSGSGGSRAGAGGAGPGYDGTRSDRGASPDKGR